MKGLKLSTQTNVQLAKLKAEQQQNINNITKILIKVDEMCQEESGMSLDELIDNYDYCIERLNAIKEEEKDRIVHATI